MSWLSEFFRRDSVKIVLKLMEKVLKIIIGQVADKLKTVAYEEVVKAEKSGKSGPDKYEAAFKGIRSRFPELKESAINFAIEGAVLALQSSKS